MLKKFLKTIFTLAILGTFVYVFYTNFGNVWTDLYAKYFPCQSPIPYNLGTFDTEFGLSKADFLADISQAEAVWDKPTGKQFFVYEPNGTGADVLKINLIYDYRQEATLKMSSLGQTVSATRATYSTLKAQYTAMQTDYLEEKSAYLAKVAAFKQGQAQLSEIRSMEADLNKKVNSINSLVTVINNLAQTLNINAAELNTIGASRGEEFTEGEFKSDGSSREIDVYEFSTKAKLIRVLAHELGHAIGLEHVADPNAIMYYLNQNTSGQATVADLAELKTVCKLK